MKQRYHLYVVIPGGASHGGDRQVLDFWRRHAGPERVIQLDSPEDASECIGLAIGMNEGTVDMEGGAVQLRRRGVVGRAVDRITRSLTALLPAAPTARASGTRRL